MNEIATPEATNLTLKKVSPATVTRLVTQRSEIPEYRKKLPGSDARKRIAFKRRSGKLRGNSEPLSS